MKLYLDNCCYNRPYDDQTQEKIHMEGEAVLAIINRCKQNNDEIIGSSALDMEIDQIGDIEKREQYENGYGDYTKEKYRQPDLSARQTHEHFSSLKTSGKTKISPKTPCLKTLKHKGKSDFGEFSTKPHIFALTNEVF